MNRSRIAATLMIPALLWLAPARVATGHAGPIPDPNLEAVVRSALHLEEKAELTDEKLKSVYVLDAVGKDVAELSGLAKCPNLASLRLAKGRVVDLSPLAGLKELNALDLSGNQVVDLRPIAGLSRLASLYLGRNKVVDLAPIAGLTRVSTLNLSENQVEDLAPLTKLPDLDLAVVDRNKVVDLGPLVQAAKSAPPGTSRWAFLRLYLGGNPLSDAAKGEQVSALRAAGVRIEL